MKKKVLFAIESLAGGGAEKILTTIIKNLNYTKFDVTVLCVVKTGIYVKEIEKYCKLISILPDYNELGSSIEKFKYKLAYKKIYKNDCRKTYNQYVKEKYDIEIAFVEGFVTKLIASSWNKESKKIAWIHIDMLENNHADANYKNIEEEKNFYNFYNEIFTVSDYVGEIFIKKFGEQFKEKVKTQYNPIDEEEICRLSRENIKEEYRAQIKLISIGRLVNQKGYDRLISIAEQLNKKYKNFEIWILGEGEQKKELQKYIEEHKLQNCFKLLGFKNNPYPYIKKSDAFICSSRSEGFSTVATEALILNKPIFTTDCSGMRELFGNFQCGQIVLNDDQELFKLMEKLVDQQYNLRYFEEQAKECAKRFKLKIRMKEVESVLGGK